jgi:hypothetical protein
VIPLPAERRIAVADDEERAALASDERGDVDEVVLLWQLEGMKGSDPVGADREADGARHHRLPKLSSARGLSLGLADIALEDTRARGPTELVRAAVWQAPGEMALANVPEPTCPPDGALLRVACRVCAADVPHDNGTRR